jgi:membrane protein required for colicin V production
LSGIDIALGILLLIGTIQGYKSGFLVELFSLLAVVLGILGGFKLMGYAMVMLDNKFNIDEKVLPYVAFAVVFLVIVIIVNLIGKSIKSSLDKSLLGSMDQFAGAALALIRSAFMISVMLWIADSLQFQFLNNWSEGAWLYPRVATFAPKLTTWLGDYFPFFKDVF